MSSRATGEIARHLRQLFGEGTLAGLTDGQLLDRFRETGDDLAFAAIVARHGPMVLDVCRAVLHDPADAEDAFQAAFLVLVRHAGSVRNPSGLGGWLYRVARRIAIRAASIRRARRDSVSLSDHADNIDPSVPNDPAHAAGRRELRTMVHEELARLPAPYRAVLVLCDLEGLSHDAAAQELRWPLGTVKGRLSRGRDRLRDRLQRRGVTGPLPALAGLQSVVSEALLQRTVTLVGNPAGTVPAAVALLVSEVLRSMLWTNVRQWTLGIGLLGLLAGGVAAVGSSQRENDGPVSDTTETAATAPQPATRPQTAVAAPPEEPHDGRSELAGAQAEIELLEMEVGARKTAIATLEDALATYDLTGRLPESVRSPSTDPRSAPSQNEVNSLRASLDRKKAEYRQLAVELESRQNDLAGGTGPRRMQPGDLLVIEVLEALPGRPLSGQRVVRPDGTVSLDFYGELAVAGLTRHEIKEKLIQHLRKFLSADVLGLVDQDPETGKPRTIPPADSDRINVDDSLNYMDPATPGLNSPLRPRSTPEARRLDALERKVGTVLRLLKESPQP